MVKLKEMLQRATGAFLRAKNKNKHPHYSMWARANTMGNQSYDRAVSTVHTFARRYKHHYGVIFSCESIGPDTAFTFLTPKETDDQRIPGDPASKLFTDHEKMFLEIIIQPMVDDCHIMYEHTQSEKKAQRIAFLLQTDIMAELEEAENGEDVLHDQLGNAGKEPAKIQRKRGPNDGTLDNCERAMELWIDNNRTLEAVAQQEGTSPRTVKLYLSAILERLDDDEKRERWKYWLIAMGHLNT